MPKLSHGQQLLLIFVVAFLLRVPTLGNKSLWLDEAFGAHHAQRAELATPILVEGTHPPLYYTFLHHWIPLAGNWEVALRLPSAASSLAGIGLLYLLARMLFDRRVALVAAALLAVSPLDVWYAQEARMYIFVTFFGLLFALALVWSRPLSLLLVAAAVGVGLYFDYLMLPLWAGLSAVWLVHLWRQNRRLLPLLYWLAGSAGGWWLYRDWWPNLRSSFDHAISSVFIFAQLRARLGLPQLELIHFIAALVGAAIAIALGALLIARLVQRPAGRRVVTLGVLLVFTLLSVLMVTPRLYSVKRVLVTGWPYVVLFMAWLLARAEKWRRWLQPLVLGVSLLASLGALALPKDDWRGATAFLESQGGPNATVWLDPSWSTFPYEYYAQGSVPKTGSVEELAAAAGASRELWLVAERFPGQEVPSSPAEVWLDEHWHLVQRQPFYRLEVKGYRPR